MPANEFHVVALAQHRQIELASAAVAAEHRRQHIQFASSQAAVSRCQTLRFLRRARMR